MLSAGHQVLAPPSERQNSNRPFAAVRCPWAADERWRHTWQADSAWEPNGPAHPARGDAMLLYWVFNERRIQSWTVSISLHSKQGPLTVDDCQLPCQRVDEL